MPEESRGELIRSAGGALAWRTLDGLEVTAAQDALQRPRPGRDLLWRAVLGGSARVVDATAGLGADSFHLAAKGAEVVMLERSPTLVALLEDALARAVAGELGESARVAAGRVSLRAGDARTLLSDGSLVGEAPVVYLDPMFPQHQKSKRSLPGKGMALLRDSLTTTSVQEETELLNAALRAATRRVVVKRPLGAEPLAGSRPSGALTGTTTRYDIYAPAAPVAAPTAATGE